MLQVLYPDCFRGFTHSKNQKICLFEKEKCVVQKCSQGREKVGTLADLAVVKVLHFETSELLVKRIQKAKKNSIMPKSNIAQTIVRSSLRWGNAAGSFIVSPGIVEFL